MKSHPKLAKSFVQDHTTRTLAINGIPFPFYIHADGIDIKPGSRAFPLSVVRIPLLVDGLVTVKTADRTQIIDPVEGDVGEWARRLVRDGLSEWVPT